jgi:hypothetical protein
MALAISLIIVAALAIVISRRLRLSSRYERAPRQLNKWSSLDRGIDPTDDIDDSQNNSSHEEDNLGKP